jgi:hypothetical protein
MERAPYIRKHDRIHRNSNTITESTTIPTRLDRHRRPGVRNILLTAAVVGVSLIGGIKIGVTLPQARSPIASESSTGSQSVNLRTQEISGAASGTPSPKPSLEPTLPDLSIYSPDHLAIPDPTLYSPEEAAIIMEIEAKYNINIFTVQQAREYAHRYLSNGVIQTIGIDSWQDTKVGFNKEQLIELKQLLNYMPQELLVPIYPQRFGIILRGDDFKDAGEAYYGSRMIGVGKDTINLSDRKGTFSLLAHEETHSLDAALKEISWLRVKDILGDKDLADLADMKAYFANKQGLSSNYSKFSDDQKGALATFSSFVPGQEFAEGIAGLSQVYVNGYESFMNAVGPLLDGNGYTSSDYPGYITDTNSLSKTYPKAQALYDYYKQVFFEGKEYDAILLVYIKNGSPSDQSEMQNASSPSK